MATCVQCFFGVVGLPIFWVVLFCDNWQACCSQRRLHASTHRPNTGKTVWEDDIAFQSVASWLDEFDLGTYASILYTHGYNKIFVFKGMLNEEFEDMLRIIQIEPAYRVKFRLALQALQGCEGDCAVQPRRAEQSQPLADGLVHNTTTFTATTSTSTTTAIKYVQDAEQRLQQELLSTYPHPPVAPPQKVQVQMSINIAKFISLDLLSSTLELAAWLRLSWNDPRLRWNASLWGVQSTPFTVEPNSLENSVIWVPDVELINAYESLESTFSNKPALTSADGSVFWSRPGKLKTLCKFHGLETFPYDLLKCDLEIGPWTLDKERQDITLNGAGISWVGQCILKDGNEQCEGFDQQATQTAGSRFQDYKLKDISVRSQDLVYSASGTVLTYQYYIYTVIMKRASMFYTIRLVVPHIAFNIISWITYFMDPNIGERLGFGITLLLAVTAQDLIQSQFMPVCDDVLILDYITWVTLCFVTFALMETGTVLFLHHLTTLYFTDLLPRCIRRRFKRVAVYDFQGEQIVGALLRWPQIPVDQGVEFMRKGTNMLRSKMSLESLEKPLGYGVGAAKRQHTERLAVIPRPPNHPPPPIHPAPVQIPWQPPSHSEQCPHPMVPFEHEIPGSVSQARQLSGVIRAFGPPDTSSQTGGPDSENRGSTDGTSPDCSNRHQNLSRAREALYMQIFSLLDSNCDGTLSYQEVETFLQLLIGEGWIGRQSMAVTMDHIDVDKSNSLSLAEFVEFCEKTFAHFNHDVADNVLERFIDVAGTWREKASQKWARYAASVDRFCRWLMPLLTLLAYTGLFLWSS